MLGLTGDRTSPSLLQAGFRASTFSSGNLKFKTTLRDTLSSQSTFTNNCFAPQGKSHPVHSHMRKTEIQRDGVTHVGLPQEQIAEDSTPGFEPQIQGLFHQPGCLPTGRPTSMSKDRLSPAKTEARPQVPLR